MSSPARIAPTPSARTDAAAHGHPSNGSVARLASLATALPPHVVRQQDAKEFARLLFGDSVLAEDPRLLAVFDHAGIRERHTCMPLEWFGERHDFGESNALYVEHALALAREAAGAALERAELSSRDLDHLLFVSSTGIATPSLDARLANALGCRPDLRRTPMWGLGCAGGAVGLARARELALAHPTGRVLLVSLELCTLTFQHGDRTRRNLVAASLFADGAAAAVVTGPAAGGATGTDGPGLEIVASRSTLWPDSLEVMGWDVDSAGLHVVFSRDIPTIVRERVRPGVEIFLAECGLSLEGLEHVIAHPGGPRVLAAYAAALGLPEGALRHAAAVLESCGNMSSPTCLFVLERALSSGEPASGEHALLTALGPGFAAEYVLLRGGVE